MPGASRKRLNGKTKRIKNLEIHFIGYLSLKKNLMLKLATRNISRNYLGNFNLSRGLASQNNCFLLFSQ